MRLRRVVLGLFAGILCVSAARADQVSTDIDKAAAAWRNHDSAGALAALQAASNVLRQMRAEVLKTVLPTPPAGWSADAAQLNAVGGATLGGGTSASRTYHNAAQQVQVQIITDSPMLQGMAALISSPLAASMGLKPVTIDGQQMSYTAGVNSYMTLVAGKVIVRVDGNKETPEPALRTFITAIDFAAVKQVAQ